MRTQQQILNLYDLWRQEASGDPDLLGELSAISGSENDIAERFYTDLVFGTGGLRGLIGAGTNRVNIYTLGRATAGLCRYLFSVSDSPCVAIAYDSRIKSELFARHAARTLAKHGVVVHIFSKLMPTPTLSFAVRRLGCDAGIVITASHNPAAYNGYKVYGADGGQITPDQADCILAQMEKCDYFESDPLPSFEDGLMSGKIRLIDDDLVTAYIDAVKSQSIRNDTDGRDALKIVYTPLYGAGRDCVLRVLAESGFQNVTVVPEQEFPDGNFPTCPYPNPEMREALTLGLDLLKKTQGDLLLATDPDCDRVGIAVRDGEDYLLLTGNEVGVLLFDYICQSRMELGTMPARPVLVKTIVTTEMVVPIAKRYDVEVRDVLTGFKFIGEVIGCLEQQGEQDRYIFGFEESYGYLSGGFVRDKDAVNGSLLIAEMAAYYRKQGRTLKAVLLDLYREYGYYVSHLQSLPFEGRDAIKSMQGFIAAVRDNPPAIIEGVAVSAFSDYLRATVRLFDGQTRRIDLPASDILRFDLADGSSVVVRPSGTEPKLKIYYSVRSDSAQASQSLIDRYGAYFSALFR
jgi:phosphoglucomutase